MPRDKCKACGNIEGHEPVAAAVCAYRAATTAEIKRVAAKLGAREVDAADLLAHLRSMHSDSDAFTAAQYVLLLGWRKTVGAS